jgi:hypothetical protein
MSNIINEWVDTKTNSGHPIYSMFSGDTERPNKNYVELGDYEKLERELNEAKELLKSFNKQIGTCIIHADAAAIEDTKRFLAKGTE